MSAYELARAIAEVATLVGLGILLGALLFGFKKL